MKTESSSLRRIRRGNGISVVLVTGILILGIAVGFCRNAIELESRYDGDGWFHYRLRTLEDPFLKEIYFGQLFPAPFVDYMTNTLPEHWTNFFYEGKWSGIQFVGAVPQARINEISFSVRSISTHFRRKNYGFSTGVNFMFADPFECGLGGYLNLDCLVPCAPEEADGSLPTLIFQKELVPDIKVDHLIRTNQDIHGVIFSWSQPSTVELQGSHDLVEWTSISRFFGNPPQTTWTTNSSLNALGRFFRLSLIANSHLTKSRASGPLAPRSDDVSEARGESFEYSNSDKGEPDGK